MNSKEKLLFQIEDNIPFNEQEESGVKNVKAVSKEILALESLTVDGHFYKKCIEKTKIFE